MVYAGESLGEPTARKLKMKSDLVELKILMKEVRELQQENQKETVYVGAFATKPMLVMARWQAIRWIKIIIIKKKSKNKIY